MSVNLSKLTLVVLAASPLANAHICMLCTKERRYLYCVERIFKVINKVLQGITSKLHLIFHFVVKFVC